MSGPSREALLDELARVALADKHDVILHALEVGSGAVAFGATSEELADERGRQRRLRGLGTERQPRGGSVGGPRSKSNLGAAPESRW